MAPVPLPPRHSDKAPKFDSTRPATLIEFFEDFEILADAAQLNDEQKIRGARRYVTGLDGDLWEAQESFDSAPYNWETFKKEVIEAYPGATSADKWTIRDLDRTCEAQRGIQVKTLAEFGVFDRQFKSIGLWLKKKGRCGDSELQRRYFGAFDDDFAIRLQHRLDIKLPDHRPDELYDIKEVQAAALHVLAGTATNMADVSGESQSRNIHSAYADQPMDRSRRETTPVKREEPDFEKLAQNMAMSFSQSIETAVANAMGRLQGPGRTAPPPAVNQAPGTYIPATQQPAYGPPRPRPGDAGSRCFMCHDPNHFLGQCPTLQQYMNAGKIRRDAASNIVLANGERIPSDPRGTSWAQRIDEHYGRAGGAPQAPTPANTQERESPPHLPANFSAHLVGVVEEESHVADTQECYLEEVVEEDSDEEAAIISAERMIQVLQNRVAKNKKKVDEKKGQDDKTEEGHVAKESPPKVASKGPREAPKQPLPYVDIPARVPAVQKRMPPPKQQQPTDSAKPPGMAQPQFRYSAPIEAGINPTEIIKRSLSEKVELSIEELLALCPDVRKFYKEATTTKRIATAPTVEANMVSAFFNAPEDDEMVEGAHSLALRTLEVSLNGVTNATCILDSGCQVIIIRQDIWKKLGMALRPDHIMYMESANGGSNATIGMLPRVVFQIGEVRLPCPVQVVDDGPFECLLGRPFTALAEATTKEYQDGDMDITLKDPNTGYVVTIPTQNRKPSKKPQRVTPPFKTDF